MPAKSHLHVVAPAGKKRAVPSRLPNSEYRKREHLTAAEIDKLIEAAKDRTITNSNPPLPSRYNGRHFGREPA